MEKVLGTSYRRSASTVLYYAIFAALWTASGLYFLLWHGRTSGWFFVLGGLFAYGAVQSRRLPYAVVNAATFTVWRSPFRAETIAWQNVVSAHRIGQRVRVELPQRKHLDVRWDGVVPEHRDLFLGQFPAHLDSRWSDNPSDTRADTWRQVLLVVVLAAVLVAVLAYLDHTHLIDIQLPLSWASITGAGAA